MIYEEGFGGLSLPAKGALKGHYDFKLYRADGSLKDEWEVENIITNEGLITMLNVMFAGQSVINNWYFGLFTNNYTPVATDTASSLPGNAGEFVSYSGGARPAFTTVAAAQPTPTLGNTASPANFTFTAAGTLIGAFLVSSATPGSNTGYSYSAAQFSSSKAVGNTDTLAVTYTTTLASS